MKANRIPEATELEGTQPPSEKARALKKALRATTLLLGVSLRAKAHEETLFLHDQPKKLEKKALEAPTATSKDGQETVLDWDRYSNTIYPELPPGEYYLTYPTGFEPGKLPAAVRELILLLGTWFLLKEKKTRDGVLVLIPIARKASG